MEKNSKIYEISYLLSPLIPEDKLNEEISILRELIEKNHGLIINEEPAKIHRLAYTIKKSNMGSFDSAYLGWLKIMAAPEDFLEIKKEFEKNQKLVRIIIMESIQEKASKKLSGDKMIKKRKVLSSPVESGPKEEIKTEEVDKKLEEIIGT
ncbi:30S ribosomal protein S6 [Patescibacteria group bacterium]|nr:30S ribosomal protein S6 [Patescibacteria group bacterium]